MDNVTFHDHKPTSLSFRDAVIDGLSREHKVIPPKFFYDERGSNLFDRICEQPEYYPPIVERRPNARRKRCQAYFEGNGVRSTPLNRCKSNFHELFLSRTLRSVTTHPAPEETDDWPHAVSLSPCHR